MFPAFARRSSIAVLLAVGLLATACTSPDDESSTDPTTGEDEVADTTSDGSSSTSVSTTIDPAASTTSRPTPGGSDLPTVDLASVAPMLLIQFGQAWADANWKAMAAVADGDVVATATSEHVDGAAPPVTGDNVVAIIESCEARLERYSWTCQLDYGADGSPTAFAMIVEQTPEGLRIIGLAPGTG